jgi:hypothetical protein
VLSILIQDRVGAKVGANGYLLVLGCCDAHH